MTAIDIVYSRYCTERFPLPTEQQVAELEQRIGIRLPDAYRHFLLKYNGGFFNLPEIAPVGEGCPQDALNRLYGIAASYPSAELAITGDLAIFDDNDPPKIIPIGFTEMGGLIILDTDSGDGNGEIYLKQAWGDFYWLAEDLEAFFALLGKPAAVLRSFGR